MKKMINYILQLKDVLRHLRIESNVPTAEIVNNSKLTKKIFFNHQLNICKNKINNINDLEKLIMITKSNYFLRIKKITLIMSKIIFIKLMVTDAMSMLKI